MRRIALILYTILVSFDFIRGLIHLLESKPVAYFPLDDSHAIYSIEKFSKYYALKYEKGNTGATILVGRAPVSLESFEGKNVIVRGAFQIRYGIIPCSQGFVSDCHPLEQKALVVDISHIAATRDSRAQ